MKKLVYVYENGNEVVHTKYISERTTRKEAGESTKVEIYECNEYELEQRLYGNAMGRYITTLMLK